MQDVLSTVVERKISMHRKLSLLKVRIRFLCTDFLQGPSSANAIILQYELSVRSPRLSSGFANVKVETHTLTFLAETDQAIHR